MKAMVSLARRLLILISASFISVVGFGSPVVAQTENKGEVPTISLGLVSEINRSRVEDNFRDFTRYVTRKLSSASSVEGKIVVAPTPFQLVKSLEQKRVDFYMDSPYPTYMVNYVHGAGKTLLRRWKGGVAEYQSFIFARRNGAIQRLDDLRGHTIVFEDPSSTSGYLLPRSFLLRAGFKLIEKRRFDPHASAIDVRYFFAYSQDKLLDLVLSSQAEAGAFSSDDFAALDDKKKADLVVLAETERLPRHLVSVRRDLHPALAGRIEKILLTMHEDEAGRRILHKADRTTKFDLLPGGEAAVRRRLSEAFSGGAKK
jgi:phosphonate transport system substrate-binding protein